MVKFSEKNQFLKIFARTSLNQPRLAKILRLVTSVKKTRNSRSSQNFKFAEALSLVKRRMVTLWADLHLPKPGKPQGHSVGKEKKRYITSRTVKFLLWLYSILLLLVSFFFHLIQVLLFFCLASSVSDDAEKDENGYEDRLSRPRAKHKLPEFKLRCWARMLVSNFEFLAFE